MPKISSENIFEKIQNKRIKNWYEKNFDPALLSFLINDYQDKGFILDPESGLLFRSFSDKTTEKIGRTVLEIVFPRPVDLHYHKDVDEALYITDGKGLLTKATGPSNIRYSNEEISKGDEIYIPKGVEHSFRPDKGDALEIKIACTGILNPSEEVCVKPFDEFEPWMKYYK